MNFLKNKTRFTATGQPIKYHLIAQRRLSITYTNGFSYGEEVSFRMLGCFFDAKLLMHEAVKTISIEAGWRLRSLFRSQRWFSTKHLILLYKSLVLSYIETFTPAIYHTANSVVERIDRIQDRLLERMSLSRLDDLAVFKLAPREEI